MEKAFKGRVVIVTGGNSGIGRALVHQLAEYGSILYITGRNAETGASIVAELHSKNVQAEFFAVDVQHAEEVENFVATVLQKESRIDYLFHCAGVILGGEIRDHKLEDIDKVLRTNVLGTAYFSYCVYRKMAEQGSGHIINIASAAGLMPIPLMGVYSSSKFAVFGLSEVLRMEGKGLGVRISTVVPGIVDTPIYDRGTYSKTDKERSKNLVKNQASTITPEKAARRILEGTVRNRAVIHTQLYARLGWMSYRYFPHIFRFVCARYMKPYRKRLREA
ncbi:MAG: Short-chain dehydrogenase/reductase [Candidatus Saccharibacteria bacterium]|nr:Short-chain dehydrogenase/reductase [Candidatus Saccharibacteria bacterium]